MLTSDLTLSLCSRATRRWLFCCMRSYSGCSCSETTPPDFPSTRALEEGGSPQTQERNRSPPELSQLLQNDSLRTLNGCCVRSTALALPNSTAQKSLNLAGKLAEGSRVKVTGGNEWLDGSRDVSAQLGLYVCNVTDILLHLNLVLPVAQSQVIVFLAVVLPLLVKLV